MANFQCFDADLTPHTKKESVYLKVEITSNGKLFICFKHLRPGRVIVCTQPYRLILLDSYTAALIVGAPILRNKHSQYCRQLIPDLDCGRSLRPFNPSLAMHNDRAFGIVRVDNFRPYLDQAYYFDPHKEGAKNLFCELDSDFKVVKHNWLSFQSIPDDLKHSWFSYEDLRLFSWQKSLWAIGALHIQKEYDGEMDLSKKICRQALVRLNGSKMSLCAIFPSPLKLREEKNWSPLIIGDNLYFAYSIDPFVLFKFAEGKLNLVGKKPLSHENIRLRGGSQFVHWKNETYISIAHRQRIKTHKIHYLHEFVVFDSKHMDLIETSEPFFLHKRGIEFAAGMIRCHNSIVISYGVSDAVCYVNRLTDGDLKDWLIS
jgi:hypothetical protein